MNEYLLLSIVGGLVAGALALGVGWLALRLFSDNQIRSIDIDRHYEQLNTFKRDMMAEDGPGVYSAMVTVPLALLYGAIVAVIMAVVLRLMLFLWSDLRIVALAGSLVWLFLVIVPVGKLLAQRARQLVILEIALILEHIARSTEETGEAWTIHASKRVSGGDLFGADEEDRLEVFVSRASEAPVTLSVSGQVEVAEAGLERTVKKTGLRQLRLKGWFVNEIHATQAEIKSEWSLHDNTYAHIAHELTQTIEALGFSVRNVRLSKSEPDERVSKAALSIQDRRLDDAAGRT